MPIIKRQPQRLTNMLLYLVTLQLLIYYYHMYQVSISTSTNFQYNVTEQPENITLAKVNLYRSTNVDTRVRI